MGRLSWRPHSCGRPPFYGPSRTPSLFSHYFSMSGQRAARCSAVTLFSVPFLLHRLFSDPSSIFVYFRSAVGQSLLRIRPFAGRVGDLKTNGADQIKTIRTYPAGGLYSHHQELTAAIFRV